MNGVPEPAVQQGRGIRAARPRVGQRRYLPAGSHELSERDRATRHTVRTASARVDLPAHGAGAEDQGQALANRGQRDRLLLDRLGFSRPNPSGDTAEGSYRCRPCRKRLERDDNYSRPFPLHDLALPHRFNILILLRSGLESIKVVIHFPFDTRVGIDRQHPFVARTSQSSDSNAINSAVSCQAGGASKVVSAWHWLCASARRRPSAAHGSDCARAPPPADRSD